MLVSMSSGGAPRRCEPSGRRRRPAAAARWRGPPGRGRPRRRRSRSVVIAGCGPHAVARVVSRAAPVGVHSSIAGAPAGPAYDGTPRSSSATAGGGTGRVPCAPRTVPEPTATGETTTSAVDVPSRARCTKPAQTPTTSAIASSAPTSWKCDVERVAAVHGRPRPRRAARRPAWPGRGRPRRGRRRRAGPGCRARCGACTESAISTWQRVAAKPLRETCSTRSATGSGAIASTARLEDVDRHAGADAGRRAACRRSRPTRRRPRSSCASARGAALRATRAANTPAPYPLSMLTTVTPGAQELSIAEQRGEAAERGAVPDAGGHRHERDAGQAADHGRQRALHAGDDDEAVGPASRSRTREQPVQPGHADVVDPVDRGAVDPHGQRGLGGDRGVGGAGADDRDGAARLRERPERHRAGDEVGGRRRAARARPRRGPRGRAGWRARRGRGAARAGCAGSRRPGRASCRRRRRPRGRRCGRRGRGRRGRSRGRSHGGRAGPRSEPTGTVRRTRTWVHCDRRWRGVG